MLSNFDRTVTVILSVTTKGYRFQMVPLKFLMETPPCCVGKFWFRPKRFKDSFTLLRHSTVRIFPPNNLQTMRDIKIVATSPIGRNFCFTNYFKFWERKRQKLNFGSTRKSCICNIAVSFLTVVIIRFNIHLEPVNISKMSYGSNITYITHRVFFW